MQLQFASQAESFERQQREQRDEAEQARHDLIEELAAAKEQLRALSSHASDPTDIFTDQGAESWVYEANMMNQFSETYLWWSPLEVRWEYSWESMLRSRVWVYLTKKLPKEMTKSLTEGDIKGCYKNMINFNSDDADTQVVELTSKALKFAKGGKPMSTWLDEFYDIMDQLETLRAPLSMNSVRAVILDSLKGDQRYTE